MPHFRVTYAVSSPDEAGARAIVDALCLEQTVELPLALVPPGTWINEHVVAKCESLRRRAIQPKHPEAGDVRWEAVVRYSDDTAGGELPQLLNVIFGNTSIKENVMVLDVALSPTLTNKFLGPRFGTAGLREILGVPKGPMLMTALKPMGSSVSKLAEMAYLFAKGGIDVIKDDHGLANQRYAPYEERVRACCAAVRRANAETGRKCVYAPCLNAPAHLVVSRAKFAKAAGAGAVPVSATTLSATKTEPIPPKKSTRIKANRRWRVISTSVLITGPPLTICPTGLPRSSARTGPGRSIPA